MINTIYSSALHEKIVMPNAELPINFIEHNHNSTGPFCILHWHTEIEMVFVQEGTISVGCKSDTHKVCTNEVIFVNSNEPHDYTILKAPIVLYCCTFDPSLLQGRYVTSYDLQFVSPSNMVTIFDNHITNDDLLREHFINMWEEGKNKVKGYEYAIKADLYGIITQMVRYHIKSTIPNRQLIYKNRNLNNINQAVDYIEKHYQQDINLKELARLLNFNSFYFCRLFKEITGVTPIKYINNYRIYQAISLMKQEPNLSITQIATNVGFNDSNYFARVFKDATAETPSIYKDKLKEALV